MIDMLLRTYEQGLFISKKNCGWVYSAANKWNEL